STCLPGSSAPRRCPRTWNPRCPTSPRPSPLPLAATTAVSARVAPGFRRTGPRLRARGDRPRLPRGLVGGPALRLGPGPRSLFPFPGPDGREALRQRHLEPPLRPRVVVEVGDRHSGKPLADHPLDPPKIFLLFRRDESESVA